MSAVRIHGEIDCVDFNCPTATYTGSLTNETGVDGNQPAGTTDDVRTAPDGSCLIQSGQSSCTFTYSRDTEQGLDELIFWIDHNQDTATDESDPTEAQGTAGTDGEPDDTDVVEKDWQASSASTLDCTPDTATNPATDDPATGATNETSETYTCTALDQFNQAPADPASYEIDIEETDDGDGAAAPVDFDNCGSGTNVVGNRAAGSNVCTFTVTSNANTDDTRTFCAFIDDTGSDTDVEAECPEPVTPDDNDQADAFQKTFDAREATTLDCTPDTATNPGGDNTHQITCQVTDQFGNAIGGQGVNNVQIDGETLAGSSNDADGTTPPPDHSQNTDNTGATTFNISNQPNQPTQRQDTICFWIDTDNDNDIDGDCAETVGTVDNDGTDVVQKTWEPSGGQTTQVNALPDSATNPTGSTHTFGVSARDANNTPSTATPILADITSGPSANQGTSQAEITCVVDNTPAPGVTFTPPQSQTHECSYTHAQFPNDTGGPGTDTIRVFADTNGNGRFDAGEPSDQITKTWSGQAFSLTLTPPTDTATAGVCNEFTAIVLDGSGNPVSGINVDVQQALQTPGNDPAENRELFFCTPTNPQGANPVTGETPVSPGNPTGTPQQGGATQFGDIQGNTGGPGNPGNNTTVHAEVGPTNQAGAVTFGIGIRCGGTGGDVSCITQNTIVNVLAWAENPPGGDNDTFQAGEPNDQSVKTWTPGGQGAVTTLNAEPETATNPNGTQHQVQVTMTGTGGAVQGVTPNSSFLATAAGRPVGDVADPNAGASPNATVANQGNNNVYTCTASNAQGISTCTFNDPLNTPPGTDTVIFWVNQLGGGTTGPDANEPQDAVQKTWTAGPQNLIIDLRCAGTGTNDDQDIAEQGIDNPGTPDCTNPVSDQDEVFTAIITNTANIGQQNIRVDFSFGQRTNGNAGGGGANNSTNDATLNAVPGGQIGTAPAGLQTFCLTDATGRCSVTLTNATPVAGDTIEVIGTISGQTVGGPATDGATKQWSTGVVNQGGTITLTPPAATNQTGTQHTVTATVRNQFGQPVQGANVDFRIVSGPNAGLVQAGMTDATTDANGNATFTYTSNTVGTDRIVACSETGGTENDVCNAGTGADQTGGAGGEPFAAAHKTWQTGPVVTNAVALDMDADDAAAAGPPATLGGCELTSATDAGRESTATNNINPTPAGQLTAGNFHRICAAAFQTNQATNQGRLAGAQITFTIAGPGRIFAARSDGTCSQAAVPPAGTTVTATANNDGFAFACLFSQQVGRTTVTASSGTPAQTATGTKDWTVSPTTARFIQLCHGDIAGTTCDTAESRNEPNDEHEMTARVTDAQGNPVANVPVQFRETGPGIFTPQGGSSATVNTDSNGLAAVLLTSDVEGTSTIVAEIDPAGQAGPPGAARSPGATGDECEAPAGTNNQPAAGNCISQTLTKVWDVEEEPFQCDDGLDNDNDGFIDFGDDPGCESVTDDDELPVNEPPKVRHDRRISIRFNDGTGARNNGLVVFGRLRVPDGFNDCRAAQPVNIQRRISGRWVTKKTTNTNRRGRYAVEIFDQASRYRAVAPRTEILDEQVPQLDVCLKAVKAKRHRHRRR